MALPKRGTTTKNVGSHAARGRGSTTLGTETEEAEVTDVTDVTVIISASLYKALLELDRWIDWDGADVWLGMGIL